MSMEIENLEMPVKSVPDKAVVSVKTASKPQKSTIDNGKDSDIYKSTISILSELFKMEDKYLDDCLEKAAENMTIDLNDEIIDDEIHRMIHQFEEQLKMQGLSLEQYAQFTWVDHEKLHEQMAPEATKRVKYRYLLEEVAEQEKIDFTEKEELHPYIGIPTIDLAFCGGKIFWGMTFSGGTNKLSYEHGFCTVFEQEKLLV